MIEITIAGGILFDRGMQEGLRFYRRIRLKGEDAWLFEQPLPNLGGIIISIGKNKRDAQRRVR